MSRIRTLFEMHRNRRALYSVKHIVEESHTSYICCVRYNLPRSAVISDIQHRLWQYKCQHSVISEQPQRTLHKYIIRLRTSSGRSFIVFS